MEQELANPPLIGNKLMNEVTRRQAYIEKAGPLHRIVKGDATGEWANLEKIAVLKVENGMYFAFQEPLSNILEPFEANNIYFTNKVKTKEKVITYEE